MDIEDLAGEGGRKIKISYLKTFEKAENMLKYALFYTFFSSFRLLT